MSLLLANVFAWSLSHTSISYIPPRVITKSSRQIEFAASTVIDKNIPKNIYTCLPKQEKELKLVANISSGKDNYYIVGIYPYLNSENDYQETLVKIDEIGCLVVIPQKDYGRKSISYYIPKETACELMVQRYGRAIAEYGGKTKYQQLLLDQSDEYEGEAGYYFPEDVCALSKLELKLPNNIRVIQDIDELTE